MATTDSSRILTKSERNGVIFMTSIGAFSTLALFILLVHLFSVSFLPLCVSVLGLRRNGPTVAHSSSTGGTNSGDVTSARGQTERKASLALPRSDPDKGYQVNFERAQAAVAHKLKARASEVSRQKAKNNEERLFLRMQLGIFIVCMFLSDLIQSLGVLAQARWAHLGRVEPGPTCEFQAATLTFGDVATAVWNSIIAIHTFCTVVLGIRMSTFAVSTMVVCGWAFPVLMNVIGAVIIATPAKGRYYDVAGAWCFISGPYKLERVVLHYVPLLCSAAIITVMYTLVALKMRGNLEITPISSFPWFSASFSRANINFGTSGNTNQKQVAYLRSLSLKMLWYPGAYTCLILPISICRMVELKGHAAPFPLLFFSMTLLFCVGLSNVAIYVSTRNIGSPRRSNMISTKPNQQGTQVEIYIDRVTQHDIDSTMMVGNRTLGGREKNSAVRFDEELGMSPLKSATKDDNSSRYSLDKEPTVTEGDTPASAQFDTSVKRRGSQLGSGDGLSVHTVAYTAGHPPHGHTSSAGSIVIERVGGVTSAVIDAPFNGAIEEGIGPLSPPRSVTRDTFTNRPPSQQYMPEVIYRHPYAVATPTPATKRDSFSWRAK